MKNISLLFICGIVFFSCTSSPNSGSDSTTKARLDIPAPVFDRPHAIVLDMWSYGSRNYEDYVKVYNSTLHENISFNVFGYDEKNKRWVLIGSARLKKVTDRDTINSPLSGELDHFRWFAIHSLDNLDFNAQAIIKSNDILITVFEEGLNEW
jgi:hypothetical protein